MVEARAALEARIDELIDAGYVSDEIDAAIALLDALDGAPHPK